jgi:hypothetical protein
MIDRIPATTPATPVMAACETAPFFPVATTVAVEMRLSVAVEMKLSVAVEMKLSHAAIVALGQMVDPKVVPEPVKIALVSAGRTSSKSG